MEVCAEQVSIPLPASMRAYLERRAAAEDRSIAAVVRRLIAEAAKREEAKGKAA
jgi:hypothetical protein